MSATLSNVTLDHATRQHLRALLSETRRQKLGLGPGIYDPEADRRERRTVCKKLWREANRERDRLYSREWRRRRNKALGREPRQKGVCAKGHKIEGANAAPSTDGRKRCRICINDYQRERKRNLRALKRGEAA